MSEAVAGREFKCLLLRPRDFEPIRDGCVKFEDTTDKDIKRIGINSYKELTLNFVKLQHDPNVWNEKLAKLLQIEDVEFYELDMNQDDYDSNMPVTTSMQNMTAYLLCSCLGFLPNYNEPFIGPLLMYFPSTVNLQHRTGLRTDVPNIQQQLKLFTEFIYFINETDYPERQVSMLVKCFQRYFHNTRKPIKKYFYEEC